MSDRRWRQLAKMTATMEMMRMDTIAEGSEKSVERPSRDRKSERREEFWGMCLEHNSGTHRAATESRPHVAKQMTI